MNELEEYKQDFTYDELKNCVDQWWESLSDDAQYLWYKSPTPTFEMYVLGKIKKDDMVCLNFTDYTFEKLN